MSNVADAVAAGPRSPLAVVVTAFGVSVTALWSILLVYELGRIINSVISYVV